MGVHSIDAEDDQFAYRYDTQLLIERRDRDLVVLDLSGMVAGSKYRGEFEERIKNVIQEVKEHQGILLFIDEIHTIIGAGGVATPADAALMMQLGAEGVFVGSGIFKSGNPAKRASSIVQAVTNYKDAKLIAKLSEDLGEAMVGINPGEIKLIMEERGK